MKVHYSKLYNMAYLFTFNVFTDFKGSNNYILFDCADLAIAKEIESKFPILWNFTFFNRSRHNPIDDVSSRNFWNTLIVFGHRNNKQG